MTRALVDTNVVISSLLFPTYVPAQALSLVLDEHVLVLTQWVLNEPHRIVGEKRPDLLPALDAFLIGIEYELVQPGQPDRPSPTRMTSRSSMRRSPLRST